MWPAIFYLKYNYICVRQMLISFMKHEASRENQILKKN